MNPCPKTSTPRPRSTQQSKSDKRQCFSPSKSLPLVVAIAMTAISSAAANADEPRPSITVGGQAEVKVSPDEAVLTFAIRTEEQDLDAAVSQNDDKVKAVMEFLESAAVEEQNIRTQLISIRPIYKKNRETPDMFRSGPASRSSGESDSEKTIKPIGYTAQRQLSIVISDLANFETIYRGLIEQGVNTVGGVEFRTTELRKHRDEARLQAVRAAKEKAAAMAGELGATLAGVISISEERSGGFGRSSMLQNSVVMGDFNSGGSSIAAGMIEVNASVSVTFRLGNTEFVEPQSPAK